MCGRWAIVLLFATFSPLFLVAPNVCSSAEATSSSDHPDPATPVGFKLNYPLKARELAIGVSSSVNNKPNLAGIFSSQQSVTPLFEVSRPIVTISKRRRPFRSCQLITATFGDTATSGPATATFDSGCAGGRPFDKVVLRWRGTSSGRQFGRISTLWLDGVELLRSGTPEFSLQRGWWSLDKDVTRFSSLFKGTATARTVTLALGNVLDEVYDGVYTVEVVLDFYFIGTKVKPASPDPTLAPPHLVKPIALDSPAEGGLWFRIGDPDPTAVSKRVSGIPRNAYRAVLEICASFHGDDESWFTNPPNEYAVANNLTFGNGPFREIAASIDGTFVGSVWPYPVIYAGAFNPLAWRPVLPIGTTVVPSFDLDITPFLGTLLDGSAHDFSIAVANALSSWLVNANLLLWIDPAYTSIAASLKAYNVSAYTPSSSGEFKGLNGQFDISASRSYSFSGTVEYSGGTVVTCVSSSLAFKSKLTLADDYGYQTAALEISSDTKVVASDDKAMTTTYVKTTNFPLVITCTQVIIVDNNTWLTCDLAHSFDTDEVAIFPRGNFARKLNNAQSASGTLKIDNDGIIFDGTGFVNQTYDFKSTNERCYQRAISTANGAISSDTTSRTCNTCS